MHVLSEVFKSESHAIKFHLAYIIQFIRISSKIFAFSGRMPAKDRKSIKDYGKDGFSNSESTQSTERICEIYSSRNY